MHLLDVKNVSKSFKNTLAVNDVSFTVGQGKMFGLLGPNGAGKTTLIRMITNIYDPDQGEILMFREKVGLKSRTTSVTFPRSAAFIKAHGY